MKDHQCSRLLRIGLLAAIIGSGSFLPQVGLAQRAVMQSQFGPMIDEDGLGNIFLPAPRELRQTLAAAEEAIQEQRYSEAATMLGAVLSRTGSEDYFLDPRNEMGTQVSLKTEAMRLLAEMPAAGLRLYELQFGAEAQVLLEEAVASRDLETMIEVTRRFPQTKAGDTALVLLGQYYLDHGQPLAGALCYDRASRSSETLQSYDPQLSLSLAICWRTAGYPEKAVEVLEDLQSRMPDARVSIGAQPQEIFRDPSEALAWLDGILGEGPPGLDGGAAQRDWTMFRGSPSRNGRGIGGAPLGNFRWRLPLAIARSDEDMLLEMHAQRIDNGQVALPSLHALVVGDSVLVRDAERLWAVDFHTGKRLWSYPWEIDEEVVSSGTLGTRRAANSARMQQLYQRMWEDSAYGQMSSDGKSVFLIDDLGYAGSAATNNQFIVRQGGIRQSNPNTPRSYNQLVALDLEREGAIRWVIGGAPRGVEGQGLNGAFFLGAPLPVMGKLYVLAELNGEIRLVVLSSETGEVEWSQQIAHVESNSILQDPLRRLAGGSPSFADGVLVCPTSSGAVVAIDVANRALLWGFQYERSAELTRQQQLFRVGAVNPAQMTMPLTWNDATITIDQGKVLITPVEADKLYCVDLLTGAEVWEPRERDGMTYAACVYEGRAILVGPRSIVAVDMSDGSEAWKIDLSEYSAAGRPVPSGRGLYAGDFYYLPTTASQLLEIDLKQGTVAASTESPAVLGNLIAHRGEIISLGTISAGDSRYKVTVDSLRQVGPLREEVSRRLEADPEDVWALARKGELLQYDGHSLEALETFRQAHHLAVQQSSSSSGELVSPTVEETRALLVAVLLDRLESDFENSGDLATELEDVIDQPQQRLQFLRLMAVGLQQVGRNREAFDYFISLLDLQGQQPVPGSASSDLDRIVQVDENLRVSAACWVEQQIHLLLKAATPAERQEMERRIDDLLSAEAAQSPPGQLSRWAAMFPERPSSVGLNLDLAEQYLRDGSALRAEMLLSQIAESGHGDSAARATLLLARLYEDAGYPTAAAWQFRRLTESWPDQVVEDGRTAQEVVDGLSPQSETARYMAESVWPAGRTYEEHGSSTRATSLGNQPLYPVPLTQASGPPTPGLTIVYDQQSGALVVRDWQGEVRRNLYLNSGGGSQYPINFNFLEGRLHGHLLVLSMGLEIVGIDLLADTQQDQRQILWRFDLGSAYTGTVPARALVQSRVYQNPWVGQLTVPIDANGRRVGELGPLSSRSVNFQRGSELICADPLTGEVIWSRRDVEAGCGLFGDKDLVFAASPTRSAARVFHAADGSEAGIRDVRHAEQRWIASGRKILTWDEEGDTVTLRLYDPWNREDTWSYQCERNSRGCIVENSLVAVMQPSGKFAILHLESGRPVVEQALLPEQLRSIYVFASRDQFLLVTHRNYQTAIPNVMVLPAPNTGNHVQLINGLIYAFRRDTGEAMWQVPARVDQYSIPFDQPGELPVLALMRHESRTRGNQRQSTSAVILIDKRDGRLLYSESEIPTLTLKYQVSGDTAENTFTLALPNKSIVLRLTEDPEPPAPPLQTGEMASTPLSSPRE